MKLSELERCLTLLLGAARDAGIDEVAAEVDGYWTIVSPEWRDVYAAQPPEPAVGSFADDEAELSKILDDRGRASAVDFERAAHLLRLLSDRLAER
jgi:hypothetical protein